MPYPAGGPQYGVKIGGSVGPGDYFPVGFQPTDAPVLPPDFVVGADATLTYDGRDTVVLRWLGPWPPEWHEALVNLYEAANGAGGRAQVRYYSDKAGAFIEERGAPQIPRYARRQGWWVWDIEWAIGSLGLT